MSNKDKVQQTSSLIKIISGANQTHPNKDVQDVL